MMEPLFQALDSAFIAAFIRSAQRYVCYAGPGIQRAPAQALAEVAARLTPSAITVCTDFDERVMRLGYGDIEAVQALRAAGIAVNNAPGLRTALVIKDDQGFVFTPTALYLEAEPADQAAPNALRLSRAQVLEALARLSPAAKAIALTQAATAAEQAQLASQPVELASAPVTATQFEAVAQGLQEAPPVSFDLARQVRVFEPYLQYVELSLAGAAIERHRLAIPASIQKLGGSQDLEGRLRTTFDLIERGSKLSSKALEDELNELRKNFTPSLGKDYGRVILKSAKPRFEERLKALREKLEAHQKTVAAELEQKLNDSRQQIIDYYLPRVRSNPPDALLGQLLRDEPTEQDLTRWLNKELDKVFPKAEALIRKMSLEVHYKDVTFETLNRPDFMTSLATAFPDVNWTKAYADFKAAGEAAPHHSPLT